MPVTEFRAGVIAGSGSISFEMIRFMTELFPIIPGPTWLNNKSQPIAVQNVIDYLLAALDNWNGHGQVFEIGGPEITYYKDLMLKYAQARGLNRRMLLIPYIPLGLMAFGVGLMTPVPRPIAYALIGGLSADSVVKHPEARTVFPEVNLIDFDTAARAALAELHPSRVERVWDDGTHAAKSLKHEGFFILHREEQVPVSPEKVFPILAQIAQKKNWEVETRESPQRILLRIPRAFGEEWLKWHVRRDNISTHLTQTTFFAPRGLRGFLYWYLLYPVHTLVFRRFIKAIVQKCVAPYQ